MNKKIFTIGIATICIVLGVFIAFVGLSRAQEINSSIEWSGSWQMGPDIDTGPLGCTPGDGIARFTGIYYPELKRVYFLGGRCETDSITVGTVFYFDPVTETFVDTGAEMSVPVSNYFMVRIDNDGYGHGPGFYIVGGRTYDGGQTNAVQVYYPDDNLAAVIASDPFPPAISYSPGGVVSLNGLIYVFGGFDGTDMYANTYTYDPANSAGSRWTLTACDLPSARSYIATVAVDSKIYAMGGDELPALTPINDTVVFDTFNPGACWQDGLMPDLLWANDNAPAVYVDDTPIGGGIFIVGGLWPSPGPDRWVFRYDLTAGIWETFPSLAIPDPATGRRNEAVVYIPISSGGIGEGIPGIWAFGGYDGSGTNAMTASTEFFANTWLLPNKDQVLGEPGDTVHEGFTIYNQGAVPDTFDLDYTSDVTWSADLQATVGPIQPGEHTVFTMTIDIPMTAVCGDMGSFTVTATSQEDPGVDESADFTVRVICSVSGMITDGDTGLPVENAYVWAQDSIDGLGVYYDAYTDAEGNFLMPDVVPDMYYFGADALRYQPSFYPDGWPGGAVTFTLTTDSVVVDGELIASNISWDPAEISATVDVSGTVEQTLTITNAGSGPYVYSISALDSSQEPPPIGTLAVPGLPRVDEQIFTDMYASPEGVADFVAVLNSQADLSAAYGIADWNERGQAVYDMLTSHADASQAGLRSFLDSQDVDYTPLYIINAVIVHNGDTALVNKLAARQDVNQLVANHQIAVEKQPSGYFNTLLRPVSVPEAIEWNITQINADDVWTEYSVKGENMVVAEIDTGTQYDHPALVSQYRGNNGDGTFTHDYNWFDPYAQCPDGGKVPCDSGRHGTHVMGTMVGYDGGSNQIGVAPGAEWISCKGGDKDSGYLLTNELLQCAQWIVAPWDLDGMNPDPSMRPDVVNNSWGGGPNDYWYTGAVDAWRAAGIFPAFANGNAGPKCSTAHSPGDYWHSFATGASDDENKIATFSSRGPALYTGYLKPQITAPGVDVRSSVPTNDYLLMGGTSMASPHSAGAVALLLSAVPELKGQVDLTAWVLEQSAMPLTTEEGCGGDLPTDVPNNTFGYGLLDIYAAVTLAKGEQFAPSWLSVSPQSGTIDGMSSADITLTFTAPATTGTYTATLWLVGDDPYNWDVRIPVTMNVETGLENIFLPFVRK